ncbi:hypothetical protein HPP92_024290 [Vanilla planifolia]|uniref:Uncharacterized protein n=1 Tax=Vanilla planifolia TaxID=51239 RepID=A0A835PPH5_VANPL|nr:hypothetical protein HPP92_024290 [Vanilla planifolia]
METIALATGLGALAGAVLAKADERLWTPPMAGFGGWRPLCPRCCGTGRVECLCARWSDGDAGCRSCSGSGRMPCSSCRGSGTGRPAPVRLSVGSNRPGFKG